jgi:hypothetical protein
VGDERCAELGFDEQNLYASTIFVSGLATH